MSEQRLERLECKLAFLESLVEQLNGVVTQQQQQIERQQQQWELVRDVMRKGTGSFPYSEAEAPPPHY